MTGEQGRVAEKNVEDQTLVGLGACLGEGVTVTEVHRHVAHLHAGTRNLRSKADRDSLIRLHTNNESVLAEFGSLTLFEQVLRCALEDDCNLCDTAAEARQVNGEWTVTKAIMSRSARVLMEGWVRVPGDSF